MPDIPLAFLPSLLVAVVGLGIGAAFLITDYRAPTSRALGVAFVAIAASIGLSVPLASGEGPVPPLGRWLAVSDALALIASLEWVRRVRRTIDSSTRDEGIEALLLTTGQAAGVALGAAGLIAPELRRDQFVGAMADVSALSEPGFWLFAAPLLVGLAAGVLATLLLLRSKPDRSERIRIVSALASFPLIVLGVVLPAAFGALLIVAGQMVFLIGAVQYLVIQGQRGQFLARFLSPQVEQLVRERGLKHAVQNRTLEITVVSCDLRGFTAFAQSHPSSSVIKTLREYYDAVGKVVAEYGGTVKDYAGDGVLILVGAPLPVPNHGRSGYEMAQLIREAAGEVTRRWSTQRYPLGVGIGVASGLVTVGIIGSASRWEYTAVGPAVNLACRLCEQAADREVLLDARTVELAGSAGLQPRAPMVIKGFTEPVAVWQLHG